MPKLISHRQRRVDRERKSYYEQLRGKTYCDNSWRRVKKTMILSGLDLTPGNLEFLARVKDTFYDAKIDVIIFFFNEVNKLSKTSDAPKVHPNFLGKNILSFLVTDSGASVSTIYGWFQKLKIPGLKLTRYYSEVDVLTLRILSYQYTQRKRSTIE